MPELEFHVPMRDLGIFPDAVLGHTLFEVKLDMKGLDRFHGALMQLAHAAAAEGQWRGVLILDEPVVGIERLVEEWRALRDILRPEILERLTMVMNSIKDA